MSQLSESLLHETLNNERNLLPRAANTASYQNGRPGIFQVFEKKFGFHCKATSLEYLEQRSILALKYWSTYSKYVKLTGNKHLLWILFTWCSREEAEVIGEAEIFILSASSIFLWVVINIGLGWDKDIDNWKSTISGMSDFCDFWYIIIFLIL